MTGGGGGPFFFTFFFFCVFSLFLIVWCFFVFRWEETFGVGKLNEGGGGGGTFFLHFQFLWLSSIL